MVAVPIFLEAGRSRRY